MGRSLPMWARFVVGFLIASSTALPCLAQTSDYNPDVAEFVHDADDFVALLHEGTTLGRWRATRNQDDQWLEYEEECASFNTIDRPPSGKWMIPWMLYFYPPPVPSPITFPDHASPRDCVLGTVQVEAQVPRRPDLARLMDTAMRDVLTYRYGQSVVEENVPFWGPYSDPNAARWINSIEIISGHSSQADHCNDLRPQYAVGDIAFVCAQSPLVRRLELDPERTYRYREIEDSQFHKALAIAQADPALTDKLQDLYTQILRGNSERLQIEFRQSANSGRPSAEPPRIPAWLPSSMPLLQQWLSQLKALPAERRAAGLLAADRLVWSAQTAEGNGMWEREGKGLSHIEKFMAEFFPSEAEKGGTYTGNWAEQARELDASGEVGQMAIIGSMARGQCDLSGPNDPSRRVILEGEKLLSKGLEAPIAAQVHFMIGDAYSDFVALAKQGLNAQGARDPDKYREEAAADRAKALEHYRAGLTVDNASENAKDAWRQAWRILAGIQPEERYVCFEEGD